MAMKTMSKLRILKLLFVIAPAVIAFASEGEYDYDDGGSDWGGFCVNGSMQSPISVFPLTTSQDVDLPTPPNTNYVSAQASLFSDHGFGPKATGAFGTFTIGSKTYNFQNFHFHQSAEHTLNFFRYPLEMHLVHKTNEGEIAVIAVFFTLGLHSPFLDQFFDLLPQIAASSETVPVTSVLSLFEPIGQYFRYMGSLTTPPCTEGVSWTVMRIPMFFSINQLAQYRLTFPEANSRPTQPLNDRVVTRSTLF